MKILKFIIGLWPIWLLYGGIWGLGSMVVGETRLLIALIEVVYFLVLILYFTKEHINKLNRNKDIIERINRRKKGKFTFILILSVILLLGSYFFRISVDYIKKDYLSVVGIYEGFEIQFRGGVSSIKISGREFSVAPFTPGRLAFTKKVGRRCKVIYAKRSSIILDIQFSE